MRGVLIALAGVIVGAIAVLAIPAPGGDEPSRAPVAPLRTVDATTLLAWTPVQLPDDLPERVEGVDGVSRVTVVRSAIVWLDGWTDEAGQEHRSPDGMRVPLEVAAIDVDTYLPFVPAADRTTLAELAASNGIVLGDRGAGLRGIRASGSLLFGEHGVDVTGVIDDGLIGAHEAVISLDRAEQLDVTRARYLLVQVEGGHNHEDVAARIRNLAKADERLRVRSPGETPEFRHGDAVLPIVGIKERFGEFAARPSANGNLEVDRQWMRDHIVDSRVPVLGTVRCHRELIPQLTAAMEEIDRRGLSDEIDRSDFGGCFSPRYLSQDEDAGLSHHSWGIAFDINVRTNPFGDEPTIDPRIVDVLERWGFAWGGRWLVKDGMHFEYLRPPLSPKG
ncbi:MAG: M15 family metallopeptidase [Actinomycetota bacterium]